MSSQEPWAEPVSNWRERAESDPFGIAHHHDHDEAEDPILDPRQQRWALLRLVVVVAAILAVSFVAGVGETVVLILAFFGCIVAHEFGHFICAKTGRVKVTEFFVGFGPRLWSVTKGETEYGVKSLPLGGYCRIIGMNNLEEVDPTDEARTYRQASLPRRLAIGVAGSAMHFLLAICLLFAMFFWTGDNGNYLTNIPASNPIANIDALHLPHHTGLSPAEKAGFRPGDRIEAVDGKHYTTWEAIGPVIRSHPDQPIEITVKRGGRLIELHPVPIGLTTAQATDLGVELTNGRDGRIGFLGLEINGTVHSSLGQSVSEAGGAWVRASALTLHALGSLVTFHGIHDYFHQLVSAKAAASPTDKVRFESPVGVVRLFHQAGQDGMPTVLYLLAILNISLGIFNLIPLLPLDGGHVAIALYEGVRSRRQRRYHADVAKLLPIFYLGLGLIVFIGVSSLFLDVRSLVT